MRLDFLSAFLSLLLSSSLFSQGPIKGQVLDSFTTEPLRYASIQIVSKHSGTVTDSQGFYLFSDLSPGDSLKFSYLGYESQTLSFMMLKDKPTFEMIASEINDFIGDSDLGGYNALFFDVPFLCEEFMRCGIIFMGPEVVIRPLDPETYLKRVIQSFALNYPQEPYELYSYYTERITENGRLLDHAEAGFYSQIDEATMDTQHQLILYHQAELSELEFMRKTAEKQKAKYIKKHPEDTEAADNNALIQADFGGPDLLLEMGVTSGKIHPLDSTRFRDFRYSYGSNSSFMGQEVITIAYSSRGKDDQMRKEGLIYIDQETDAIVAVKESGKLVIPALLKPILFAMGIEISNPVYHMDLRYRPYQGRWFMEQLHWDVDFGMKKRHWFKENEKSRFYIAQTMLGREIGLGWSRTIETEQVFDKEEAMEKQVAPFSGVGWEDIR